MARKVVWSSRALNELEHTVEYLLTNFSKKEVVKLEKAINQIILLIDNYPRLFPISHKQRTLRKATVLKYNSLIYKVEEHEIIILAFFSNRQNPIKGRVKE